MGLVIYIMLNFFLPNQQKRHVIKGMQIRKCRTYMSIHLLGSIFSMVPEPNITFHPPISALWYIPFHISYPSKLHNQEMVGFCKWASEILNIHLAMQLLETVAFPCFLNLIVLYIIILSNLKCLVLKRVFSFWCGKRTEIHGCVFFWMVHCLAKLKCNMNLVA